MLSTCLLPDRRAEFVSPGIWSTLAAADRPDSYDKVARGYDWVVGNSVYNRIVWGCPPQFYTDAATRAIERAADGPIIDVGCGSLVFTANAYRPAPLDRMILFDRSLEMMRRGRVRLPAGQFVQGDAFNMPFQSGCFSDICAWGFLHVVGSKSPLLAEMARIAAPGAAITISTLVVTERQVGNQMLRFLHSKGEASTPETAEGVVSAFER